MLLGKIMNTFKALFKIKINHIIDSLASKGIKLIRLGETNLEDLTWLEWKIKSIIEESRTIIPYDYSTYQKKYNTISIKFRGYKEEANHESDNELDMRIIDKIDDELIDKPDTDDNYNPDAYYYYSIDSKEEDNPDYYYTDGAPLDC